MLESMDFFLREVDYKILSFSDNRTGPTSRIRAKGCNRKQDLQTRPEEECARG